MFSALPKSERGNVFDTPRYVARLMRSADERAFLIVHIAHSSDFLQLTGDARGVQIDFPMVTPRQRGFEARIREVSSRESLAVVENHGSDGTRFLDIDVAGTPEAVAAVCSKILRGVYNVSGEAELVFQHSGLAPGDDG